MMHVAHADEGLFRQAAGFQNRKIQTLNKNRPVWQQTNMGMFCGGFGCGLVMVGAGRGRVVPKIHGR